MTFTFFRYISTLVFLLILVHGIINGQNKTNAHISGNLSIDETWDSIIYLAYIPTYDDMFVMSNEMIIANTEIDSLGYFEFDIDFLPNGKNLYRLHIIKKGDTPATLIIGGKDENHLFIILNRFSNIQLISKSLYPPFKYVTFKNSKENTAFHQISQMVFIMDSIAAESSASKRLLIEDQLQKDLLFIADTSNNFLVSLYAIYKSRFESNYSTNIYFYKSYIKSWINQDNAYFKSFAKQLPININTTTNNNNSNISVIVIGVILAFILIIIGFFLGKRGLKKSKNFEKLSIQERKIYELLQQGVTNQEISNHFNIGLSTVKSHVSSIYSKLNVKSRKDIINMK